MIETASPYLQTEKSDGKKNIFIIIGVVIAAILVVGGIILLRQPQKSESPKTSVIEESTPSPTEKPKIDRETVKIQVLNGTGTPGQAGTAVDALKKAGFNEENIKAENAPDFDHAVTTVSAKAGFKDVANDIKTALDEIFDSVEIDSSVLDGESEFDIVVITGGKKFEEKKTSPAPSPTGTATSPTPSPTGTTVTSTPSPTPSPTP